MCVDLDNEDYDVGFVPVVPREKCQGYLPCNPHLRYCWVDSRDLCIGHAY